jgi:hypothetical protein
MVVMMMMMMTTTVMDFLLIGSDKD